jgi:hypothetical protein
VAVAANLAVRHNCSLAIADIAVVTAVVEEGVAVTGAVVSIDRVVVAGSACSARAVSVV